MPEELYKTLRPTNKAVRPFGQRDGRPRVASDSGRVLDIIVASVPDTIKVIGGIYHNSERPHRFFSVSIRFLIGQNPPATSVP